MPEHADLGSEDHDTPMHPRLIECLAAAELHFRSDPRCAGMFLHGSIGRGETDAYSDIDVCAVIEDEHYEDVKAEMRAVCERLFGPIVIWLPEGEQPRYCNFAFLFEHGDELLLTDFDIVARSLFVAWNRPPDRVLWDRDGLLSQATRAPGPQPGLSGERLLRLIDTYWVYAYLGGKYMRRGDVFKMLYVQQTLFQVHVRMLCGHQTGDEGVWWAGDMARLSEHDRHRLLGYFSAADTDRVAEALSRCLDRFSEDAQRVCADLDAPYPIDRELAVRKHLATMGLRSGLRRRLQEPGRPVGSASGESHCDREELT